MSKFPYRCPVCQGNLYPGVMRGTLRCKENNHGYYLVHDETGLWGWIPNPMREEAWMSNSPVVCPICSGNLIVGHWSKTLVCYDSADHGFFKKIDDEIYHWSPLPPSRSYPMMIEEEKTALGKEENNPLNPSYYKAYKGIEIIQLTEQMNFCLGNAVKYVARAGLKNEETKIEDLEKAVWYIQREIEKLKKERSS
jgi:hypothetical protein